jgi:hypothetical protein
LNVADPFQFDFKKGGGSSKGGAQVKSAADKEKEYLRSKIPQFAAKDQKSSSSSSSSSSSASAAKPKGGARAASSSSSSSSSSAASHSSSSLLNANLDVKLSEEELDDVLKLVDEAPEVRVLLAHVCSWHSNSNTLLLAGERVGFAGSASSHGEAGEGHSHERGNARQISGQTGKVRFVVVFALSLPLF